MCVATSIIVAGVAAGGTLASAKIQSNAAKKAAQTQSDAGDKALAFQREQYQQARSEFNPYQQAGYGALGRLGSAASAPPVNFQPGRPSQLGLPQGVPPPAMARTTGGPGGPGGGPGAAGLQGTPVAGPGMPPPAAQGGPGGPIGPAAMVLMRAPDGSQQRVPQQFVPKFQAAGATVIG